jgi:hypothetical protein
MSNLDNPMYDDEQNRDFREYIDQKIEKKKQDKREALLKQIQQEENP